MPTLPAAALPLAAIALLVALGACEASDEAIRNEFRQGSIEGCLESSRDSNAPPGFDWQRLCSCATDRVMEGKSARELAQLQPGTPEQREIVAQCMAEIRGDTKAGR
jgi:hypothetical protein